MSNGVIKVDEASLNAFRNSFKKAGDSYMTQLKGLTAFIEEVTKGHIQGDPAIQILNKYNEKKAVFKNILDIIDEGYGYMGLKTKDFSQTLSNIKGSMK